MFTIFNMYYISTRTDLNEYALKSVHMISRHTYLSTTVIAPHFGVKQTVPSAERRPTLRRLNLNEGYLSYIYKPRVYPSTRCFIRANSCWYCGTHNKCRPTWSENKVLLVGPRFKKSSMCPFRKLMLLVSIVLSAAFLWQRWNLFGYAILVCPLSDIYVDNIYLGHLIV